MEARLVLITFAIIFLVSGCAQPGSFEQSNIGEKMAELKIVSPAFESNGKIPKQYTCQGDDINPPLEISNIPENAKSLVLIVDDPDAPSGVWVHWVVWNMPIVQKIDEDTTPDGSMQGLNDFGKHDYYGPCPPSGTHRYFFKVYALGSLLELNQDSKKEDVEKAMEGHVLAKGELIGTYSKEAE